MLDLRGMEKIKSTLNLSLHKILSQLYELLVSLHELLVTVSV